MVFRGRMYSVNAALDQATSEGGESVTSVDGNCGVLHIVLLAAKPVWLKQDSRLIFLGL